MSSARAVMRTSSSRKQKTREYQHESIHQHTTAKPRTGPLRSLDPGHGLPPPGLLMEPRQAVRAPRAAVLPAPEFSQRWLLNHCAWGALCPSPASTIRGSWQRWFSRKAAPGAAFTVITPSCCRHGAKRKSPGSRSSTSCTAVAGCWMRWYFLGAGLTELLALARILAVY